MKRLFAVILFVVLLCTIVNANTILNVVYYDGSVVCEKINGDITFSIGKIEMLRLCDNGDFLVDGIKTTKDSEVYSAFRQWVIENKGDLRVVK